MAVIKYSGVSDLNLVFEEYHERTVSSELLFRLSVILAFKSLLLHFIVELLQEKMHY